MSGLQDPADQVFEITPSDVTNLNIMTRGIYVEATGDLHFLTGANNEVTLTNLAAGIVHPIVIKRIYSTGTTCSGIFGFA